MASSTRTGRSHFLRFFCWLLRRACRVKPLNFFFPSFVLFSYWFFWYRLGMEIIFRMYEFPKRITQLGLWLMETPLYVMRTCYNDQERGACYKLTIFLYPFHISWSMCLQFCTGYTNYKCSIPLNLMFKVKLSILNAYLFLDSVIKPALYKCELKNNKISVLFYNWNFLFSWKINNYGNNKSCIWETPLSDTTSIFQNQPKLRPLGL